MRPIDILLVEDNPGAVRLTREALRDEGVRTRLHVAADGEEAMAFLRNEGGFSQAPRPDLILLDLNLPGKKGSEVLAEVKSDPELQRIPVVVLTTSEDQADISAAYGYHANGYITKPVDLEEFLRAVRAIEEFWFRTVRLPR